MGILDDVTFAEEPLYPKGSRGSLGVTDEDFETVKQWLDSATEEEKVVTVDGAVTKTDYSNNRVAVRQIFKNWRSQIVDAFDLDGPNYGIRPQIINFYTLSYSNTEDFEYNHTAGLNPHDDFKDMYHLAIVLKGSFKTDKIDNPLAEKENYFVFSNEQEEVVSNSGQEDSLVFFINLGLD